MYRSSAAYSFTKGKKVPKENFLDSTHGKPDPGKYQQQLLHKSNTGYRFLKEPKMKGPRSDTPGVGKYNVNTETNRGPKYSVYQHNKETEFAKLVKDKKRKPTPGPGKYDSKNETVKPRTVLGKFSKLSKSINYDNKKPGVGQYNITTSNEFGKSAKNKFSISKSQRSNIVDLSKNSSSVKHKNDIKALEPGYYTLKPDFGGGRKALLRGKPKEPTRPKTPGPTTYKHEEAKRKIMYKSPYYSLGYGKKTSVIRTDNKDYPGPGKYPVKNTFDVSDKSKIKAATFAKSKRMPGVRSKTPGPGQYKVPCSFGYTSPYSGIENKYV